jgi:hypothetical protein
VGVQVPSPVSLLAYMRGSSSVVEHHLAKVGVASSNLVFRFFSKAVCMCKLLFLL